MTRLVLFLNQKFKHVLLLSTLLFTHALQADVFSDYKEDITFDIHSGYAVGSDDLSNMGLLTVGLGYELSSNIQFSVAVSSFISDYSDVGSSSSTAGEFYVSWKEPLSDDFSIYADLGVRSQGGYLLAGGGVRTNLSPSWSVDLGYRYYNEPHNALQGDIYALHLGLNYTFTDAKRTEIISNDVYFPPIETNEMSQVKIEEVAVQCGGSEYATYIVVKYDHFYRIANKLGLSVHALIDLNKCQFDDVDLIYPGDKIFLPTVN